MKTAIKTVAALALLLALCAASPVFAGAGNQGNPGVLPPQSLPDGKTYGEWGAEWWKWVYAQDYGQDPVSDPDGTYGAVGQSGEVWFLAGTFGGAVERTIRIPVGKKLFFPIVNIFADYPCPPDQNFEPPPGKTLEQFLLETAAWYVNHTIDMAVTVDGNKLNNLWNYRGASPLTTFTGDVSWAVVDPCVTGGSQVGVSDGYWIMLAPLGPGKHEIHFTATVLYPWGTWSLDVTYHITVAPEYKK